MRLSTWQVAPGTFCGEPCPSVKNRAVEQVRELIYITMLHSSPYKPLEIPEDLSVPDFVLQATSDQDEAMPLLYPCPQTTRKSTTPISLGQVRAQAKAMATSLLSPHIEGGAWKRGDVIVVYSENQHDYLLAVLGVMMSGGVAALSNPMYKPDEMRHVFDLTKPRAILASVATYEKAVQAAKSYEELCKHDITVYVFDEDHERSYLKLLVEPGMKLYNDGDDAVHRVPFSPKEQDAIYCFSSGTSGLPKAVRLSHFNLIANAIQMTATLGGRINKPSEKFVQWYDQPEAPIQDGKNEIHYSILPQFHCYGMLTSLINLHTLTPAVIAARFSPETFFSTVEEFHVTFAFVVPPISTYTDVWLTSVIALVRSPLAKKYDLSSIKSLASGAASLSKELCELVRDKYGLHVTDGTYLYNSPSGYGMTESMFCVYSQQCLPSLPCKRSVTCSIISSMSAVSYLTRRHMSLTSTLARK